MCIHGVTGNYFQSAFVICNFSVLAFGATPLCLAGAKSVQNFAHCFFSITLSAYNLWQFGISSTRR